MSATGNAGKKEKSGLMAMLFSSPGMTDQCKIVLQSNRRNILLLSRLIEAGFLTRESGLADEMLSTLPEGAEAEFKVIQEELLKKSGLTDFYEKLKQL